MQTALQLAVIGAGPVGLALALLAGERLPQASVSLFDARRLDAPLASDARTLALSLGSVQLLRRLGAWPESQAQPIRRVHVSQAPPSWRAAAVHIEAADQGVEQLGAVLGYGALVHSLQQAWLRCQQQHAGRLHSRFGHPVAALKPGVDAVEVDAGIVERFDLVVLAEGGVFEQQQAKDLRRDYAQVAWVGNVVLAAPHHGVAYERFTRQGPLALLPLLPEGADPMLAHRAALVWCTDAGDDSVATLDEAGRLALLRGLLPAEAPPPLALPRLTRFALGLNARQSLVDGRVVHVGNAAQTLHPVAGQGLNLGLRDAYALVEALHDAPAPDAALSRFTRTRGADRYAMMAATDLLARSFTWPQPPLAGLRGVALAALQHVPPLKHALARHLMFGWR